jgi:23S rRNA (guanosine2251-2'-O)-methyltransferase
MQQRHQKKSLPNKLYAFGVNQIEEALDSGKSINKIWMLAHLSFKFKDLELKARVEKIPVIKLEKKEYEQVLNKQTAKLSAERTGPVFAELSPIKLEAEEILYHNDSFSKIICPVNIEDPHNLGAIIRTAFAFGCDALLLGSRNSTPITETVVASSAGAVFKLPIIRIGNLVNTIEKLKKHDFWIYGTEVSNKASQDYNQVKFDRKTLVLVGNEGKGLTDNIKRHCDFMLHIPTKFNSLNVSVATGVILSKVYSDSLNG